MTKIELLQAIGEEVCENCLGSDCGIDPDECGRMRAAEALLDDWLEDNT